MRRYFIEVRYHGSAYSGFQVQDNAPTVQAALEKAIQVLTRQAITLTGSSRTDAGVHAMQNYFHFDSEYQFTGRHIYNINSLLPIDIAVISLTEMPAESHCRFDAIGRVYKYQLTQQKDPFLFDRSYYYPFTLDIELMQQAARTIIGIHDFNCYSKRNTQVKTFMCTISESAWIQGEYIWTYTVRGNRFLRGMVRGLVGTMLKVGTGRVSLDQFNESISSGNSSIVDFAVPGKGLILEAVEYPGDYFNRVVRL